MLAAQVAHAAGSSSRRHPPGTYVVVLAAESEGHLAVIAKDLASHKIPHTRIVESDPPLGGQLTAIGVDLLVDRSSIRKVVSSLPLLGRD